MRRERVEIESIAAGGEGVAHLADGRAIFVHRTAPGDAVEVVLVAERPRWARGRLLEIVHAGPDRRAPPCPHYAQCGGCTLEHLTYTSQLTAKSRIVADALRRIGGMDVDEPTVVASPREFGYRNRVSFALRRGGRHEVHAGFHALHDPDRIVPIDGSCLLPEAPIREVWDRLRAAWGKDAGRLPAGQQIRLTLRATRSGAVSLLIEGGNSPGDPEALLAAVAGLEAIWWRPGDARAEFLAGSPEIAETWGEEEILLGGAAFLQVNRWAAELLEEFVVEVAGRVVGMEIVDAYCGVGVHARRLGRAGARVTGIELDPDAVRIAAERAGDGDRYLHGRVEDLLPGVLPADIVLLNPPRGGLDEAVTGALVAGPPDRIIYISCDPATLARDLKRLRDSFDLARLRCFDLFPQTAHVETVVELTRKDEEAP